MNKELNKMLKGFGMGTGILLFSVSANAATRAVMDAANRSIADSVHTNCQKSFSDFTLEMKTCVDQGFTDAKNDGTTYEVPPPGGPEGQRPDRPKLTSNQITTAESCMLGKGYDRTKPPTQSLEQRRKDEDDCAKDFRAADKVIQASSAIAQAESNNAGSSGDSVSTGTPIESPIINGNSNLGSGSNGKTLVKSAS